MDHGSLTPRLSSVSCIKKWVRLIIILFNPRLFEIAPDLQDLFPFKGQELTDQNELLKKHAVQVMETVGTAIGIIHDKPALKDALTDLGIVHHMKSVKIDDFAVS